MLAALNHPNIAAIYGVEESDGAQALVLELVEGVLAAPDDDRVTGMVRREVEALCRRFPLYSDRQA